MSARTIAALLVALPLLAGCTAAKNLFSGNDDTVLPGQRESVLPPEQQTARDPTVTGDQTAMPGEPASPPCDPTTTDCNAPVDQEAGPVVGQ